MPGKAERTDLGDGVATDFGAVGTWRPRARARVRDTARGNTRPSVFPSATLPTAGRRGSIFPPTRRPPVCFRPFFYYYYYYYSFSLSVSRPVGIRPSRCYPVALDDRSPVAEKSRNATRRFLCRYALKKRKRRIKTIAEHRLSVRAT